MRGLRALVIAFATCAGCSTPKAADDAGPTTCPTACPTGLACLAGRCALVACTSSATCSVPQACLAGYCADQSCSPPCAAGQVCLDELCIAKAPGNCASAADCPTGDSCLKGFCSQPGCSPQCPGGQVCLDALCIPPSGGDCAAPYVSCSGGAYCANLSRDSSNCGACGESCPSGEICSGAGLCAATCVASETLCGGRCVDELSDENNCGACGTSCPAGQACSAGSCGTTCAPPYANCGSGASAYCADEANDRINCGGCGKSCPAGDGCVAGSCSAPCPAVFVSCAGVCTDTRYDPGNCGGCGLSCATGGYCNQGACEYPQAGDAGTDAGPFAFDASVPASVPAGGPPGLVAAADGGVTVAAVPSFSSDFFYATNTGEATVSRIEVPAVGAPYERARYFGLVPIDNHGLEPLFDGGTAGVNDIWQSVVDQYSSAGPAQETAPSTQVVVDRRGSAWVLVVPAATQPGVTEILDVGDHLADCTPRCALRHLLKPNQSFTEGVPLQTAEGATVMLSPPGVIAAGSAFATTYYCEDLGADPTGLVETDPRNYDDCVELSIPLGPPHADPNADPGGLTQGLMSVGGQGALVLAPNCDPSTNACDLWLYLGNRLVRLGHAPSGDAGAAYDVESSFPLMSASSAEAVDCSGILWTVGELGNLFAVTTVPIGLDAGEVIPATTVLTVGGLADLSSCSFGSALAVDRQQRVWLAASAALCSFDGTGVVTAYAHGGLMPSQIQANWRSYDLSGHIVSGSGAGVATDLAGNVYVALTGSGGEALSFNPDVVGGGTEAMTCGNPTIGAGSCPSGLFNWLSSGASSNSSTGIDLDGAGDVWVTETVTSSAAEYNGATGTFMSRLALGTMVGTTSEFAGNFVRSLAPSQVSYAQTFAGCGGGTVATTWGTLGYTASVPAGTDLAITVTAAASPAGSGGTSAVVCPSVQQGRCNSGVCTPCTNPIDVAAAGLPATPYLIVTFTLVPQLCGQNGGASVIAAPVVDSISVTGVCP